MKFTFKGGSICVKLAFQEPDILTTQISDSGQGIKGEDFEKLFKFFGKLRTENINRGGTGLGLTISKMIAEKLSGSITFNSELGVGTTFIVTIKI